MQVVLTVRFPWWAEIYLLLVGLVAKARLPINPEAVAYFLVDHTRFDAS